MRKGGGHWRWQLAMMVQLVLFLHGVKSQQQQSSPSVKQSQQKETKPQVYWASPVVSSNTDNMNRRFQQPDEWNVVVGTNYLDRQWTVPAPNSLPTAPSPPAPPEPAVNQPPPAPAPVYSPPPPPPSPPAPAPVYAPPPSPPAPAPVYAPPPSPPAPAPMYAPPPSPPAPAPVYAPPPPSPSPPAPAPIPAPPTYPDPAPSAYPDPAPPAYPDPAPPAYPDPAPQPYPSYDPAPQRTYDYPAPSYGGAPSPPGYYYYYYPVKAESKGPTLKDLIEKEKEAVAALMPEKLNKLTYSQKVWLSILSPLIIVALVIPLMAILFSGFTITTNGRKFGELNLDEMKKDALEIAAQYGTILESDECMQRIICDLGSVAQVVPGKSYILTFLATLVPDTMKNNMAIFQKAATYGSEKAQCNSFKCSAWKY